METPLHRRRLAMIERPRGTNDWGPEDMAKRRFVESRFVQLAESFGFREVSTPTFESLDLFTAKSGPGIVRELYTFKDQGGRDLALRPEFTAPLLRFYVAELRSRQKPLKLYKMGNVFRYEEPQKGRYREFSQLNVEILGGSALPSDAEVLALAIGTMRAIGLKQVKARIGNIGILRSLLPFGPADQALVLHSLDKRNFEMLDSELGRLGRPELAEPLRKSVGLAGNASILAEAKKILAGAAPEGFEYLRSLGDLLTAYGIPPTDYDFDMGVVRGLDYYTGMVFEIDSPNLGSEKQVGGGGDDRTRTGPRCVRHPGRRWDAGAGGQGRHETPGGRPPGRHRLSRPRADEKPRLRKHRRSEDRGARGREGGAGRVRRPPGHEDRDPVRRSPRRTRRGDPRGVSRGVWPPSRALSQALPSGRRGVFVAEPEALFVGTFVMVLILLIFLVASLRTVREGEFMAVFRLGRAWTILGPGLGVVIPLIDRTVRVDVPVGMASLGVARDIRRAGETPLSQ